MGIFSTSDKKKDELALVFDVGSSSVGGALFWMQASGVPKIIYTTRESIPLENDLQSERLLFLTIQALRLVAGKICLKGIGVPTRVFCVLSSPWYGSQTRTIRLQKNTPFVFTSKLADDLIAKEIALFEEEYMVHDKTQNKIRPIELKNMKTSLNGYPTSVPYNQKAKELEMSIFVSMSGENILKKIEEAIGAHFHDKTIKFSSFIMASFTVARDMFINQDNFLLINIGGELTDISIIKKDSVKESISYPTGRNFMIRGIAHEIGCTLDEAKTYMSMYKEGHMAEKSILRLEPAISKLKTEWLRQFQESLSNLTNDISIPATIFITVDQDLVDFFSEIIKTEQFSQYTLTESKFRIIFLGTEALHGIALFDDNVSRDPFLIIESIYINRFLR